MTGFNRTTQGVFRPINPKKYKGDATRIIYRSSWELKAMQKFDRDPRIEWWSSEEFIVQYYNPAKQREARYFPDFLISINHGAVSTVHMIEVKPHSQCFPPKPPKTKRAASHEKFIRETLTYAENQAKWKAAEIVCQKAGWKFQVFDEYLLGIKKRPKPKA